MCSRVTCTLFLYQAPVCWSLPWRPRSWLLWNRIFVWLPRISLCLLSSEYFKNDHWRAICVLIIFESGLAEAAASASVVFAASVAVIFAVVVAVPCRQVLATSMAGRCGFLTRWWNNEWWTSKWNHGQLLRSLSSCSSGNKIKPCLTLACDGQFGEWWKNAGHAELVSDLCCDVPSVSSELFS